MPDAFRTIIEPFRIHSVEPLRLTTAGDNTNPAWGPYRK